MWAHPLTSVECRNSILSTVFLKCIPRHTVFSFRIIYFTYKNIRLKTSIQSCPALLVLLTSTSVAPHVYSPAWHDTQENSTEPIHLQRVHNTPPSSSTAHPPFFLCQAATQDCHNRKEVWVPFLNLTLFCIIKKEKDLPWSTLPPVWQPGCLGHPCDPETQRESKGESRYPTPHPPPQHCGAERPGEASNPPQLLLLLLHTKLILRCAHSSWENQQSPQQQEGSHVVIRELR